MNKKSILLAGTDTQALVEIGQVLGAEWEAVSAVSEPEVLAQFETRPFDALLVDFNLGSPDASELLNQVLEKYPETVRFLLAYEADLALVAAKVQGSSQILPKPIEFASLKSRIESGVIDADSTPGLSQTPEPSNESPTISPLYSDVLKTLDSPEVTPGQVAEVIGRDAALTAELLKLTRSTHLGLPHNITEPAEAVESLGLEAVRGLVLARQFLAEHSRLKPGYLSLDQIWQHSVNVAQIARDLVLFETKDRALAAQALTAGLLHDLGKIVLITNFDDLYGRVHSLARKQPVTLWDVEKEMFGANHGEIGACLLGMWNLPRAIVDAAALHHEPPLGEHDQLTPLAAVHIANVFERELRPADADLMVGPIISTPFLNELGLLQRLPVWRAAFANRRSSKLDQEIETDEMEQSVSTAPASISTSRTANHLRGPETTTRTTTSRPPESQDENALAHAAGYQRRWVYAGAAAVLILLALWFRPASDFSQTEPIYARTPVSSKAPAAAPSIRTPETPATSEPETEAVAVSEEPSASSASATVHEPEVTQAARQSNIATTPSDSVTNVPPPAVIVQLKATPDFRVNAIIYTAVHPSAIVNGETVSVGDHVSDATVIAISRTSVTLELNGQHKSYQLR